MSTARQSRFVPAALALSIALSASAAGQLTPQRRLDAGPQRAWSPDALEIVAVGHGFGTLLPHRVLRLGPDGQPTSEVLEIRTLADLVENVTPSNPVAAAPPWPTDARLPSATRGNHYVFVRFSVPPDVDTILDGSPGGQANGALLGTITVSAHDPLTGTTTPVPGRGFVGGATYSGPSGQSPALQRWVRRGGGALLVDPDVDDDGDGVPDGLGFPGTEDGTFYPAALDLAAPHTFVFVADSDGRLDTHETFPAGAQIQVRISTAVRTELGRRLRQGGFASGTVGADTLPPALATGFGGVPLIVPGNGDVDVDPATDVHVRFSEAVQPLTVGAFTFPATTAGAFQLGWGPGGSAVMPYTALPTGPYDLATYVLEPVHPFPGASSGSAACDDFARVDVTLFAGGVLDLGTGPSGPLANPDGAATFFLTGPGPGVVNAPVAPDAIYLGLAGGAAGLSVIDLNGFGASTGDPTYVIGGPIPEGSTHYPDNPNVRFQGGLIVPPLTPGECTLTGGSAGVFTRTLDSGLQPVLAGSAVVAVGDLALGAALDTTFDNAPAPFGCQSGGGNLCALDGLKQLSAIPFLNTVAPGGPVTIVGGPNPISWGPHPNPPPLVFPPLCHDPWLDGLEPTSIDNFFNFVQNLLVPGDAFGNPQQGIPPSGLLSLEQNTHFVGPSPPQPQIQACNEYQMRQKVGHFLYVADPTAGEVVVLDSNRMNVIDRIALADATEFALDPNLRFLAVVERSAGRVSFVDVDPDSATFHQVVAQTAVGAAPRGAAWQPEGEDLFVCNEGDDTVSVVSGFTLQVRKTLAAQLTEPFAVAVTSRQVGFGADRRVYHAWILNRDGCLAVFESGPDGPNGWGYDDVIGLAPFTFENPKAIQPDHRDLEGAVWIAHERPLDLGTGMPGPVGEGALTLVEANFQLLGPQLLPGGPPSFRDMTLALVDSVGEERLSGIPVDLAFDDQRNQGALPGFATVFSPGVPAPINGKSLVRDDGLGTLKNTNEPRFVLVAVPAAGVVDVLDLTSGNARFDVNAHQAGLQSVPAPGAAVIADYFRQ